MQIIITSGTGEGPTSVAAFDAALINAGVSNYNLLCRSWIIPAGSTLKRARFISPETENGHRLYVVIARHNETSEGKAAWAGLGWTQEKESGRGLFVELHGSDKTVVEKPIRDTLKRCRPAVPFLAALSKRKSSASRAEASPCAPSWSRCIEAKGGREMIPQFPEFNKLVADHKETIEAYTRIFCIDWLCRRKPRNASFSNTK